MQSTLLGLDQQHAGIHATPQSVDIIPFIWKNHGLCRETLEVRIRSADVVIGENIEKEKPMRQCENTRSVASFAE
jgi:hypothetical protein